MSELCGDGCHIICDFCCHYKDDSELNGTERFEGEGECDIDNSRTDASSGCDNFKCMRLN